MDSISNSVLADQRAVNIGSCDKTQAKYSREQKQLSSAGLWEDAERNRSLLRESWRLCTIQAACDLSAETMKLFVLLSP